MAQALTEQFLIDKIAELKEEMRDMVNGCEVQERSLNETEISEFEIKESEIKTFETQLIELQERSIPQQNNTDKQDNTMNKSFKQTVAEAMQAIANNRSTADFENVAGNTIQLRANETQTPQIEAVQSEVRTELLEPLQDALLVNKLGVKVINTGKAVVMPSVNSVEASIEGEITELVGQKLDFAKTKVNPFRIGLSLPFSNTAIKEADINLVSYAINLCGKAEAQLINKIMFSKTAVNGQKGAFVDKYTAATVATDLDYEILVQLNAKVKGNNVGVDSTAAYVMNASTEAKLKCTPKYMGKDAAKNGNGGMIIENGTIDGYPVLVSEAVKDYIGFGVFSNYMIQKVGSADMVVDNLSRSKENIIEINFNDNIALQVVRGEAFDVIKLA